MSFKSVLQTIGHAFAVGIGDASAVGAAAAPVLGLIPGVGTIADTLFGGIAAVEALITPSGSGAAKKATVTQIVNAVHPGIAPATLSDAIDGIVAALNLLQDAVGKLPATAPAPAATPAPAASTTATPGQSTTSILD